MLRSCAGNLAFLWFSTAVVLSAVPYPLHRLCSRWSSQRFAPNEGMAFDPATAPRAEEYPLWPAPWRLWNQEHRGLRYALEAYPERGGLILHGWCFDQAQREPPPLRVLINGKKESLRSKLPRCEVPLLYPDYPQASRCGFKADLMAISPEAQIDLQALVRDREWETLCSFIYESRFATQWERVLDLVERSGLIDASWYLSRARGLGRERRAAVSHYLRLGAAEGRDPNPLFFSRDYWKQAPGALEQGANPLLHYLAKGATEGIRPNPFFDSRWYLHRYDKAKSSGLNPLAHYLHYGKSGQFNPSVEFNARFYLQRHPEVRRQKIHPLVHYLHHGLSKRGAATPDLEDCWHYRGPRFDPSVAPAAPERPRPRVAIIGHLLGSTLFGSENSLLELIAAIDPARFDLFAFFPEKNEEVFARIQSQVQGICVLDYFWWHRDLPFQEKTIALFERLYRELAIDLVHVNTIMLSDPHLAAQRVGIPSIAHVRELISGDETLAARLGSAPAEIGKIVCRQATYLLANSAATLADYPCRDKGGYVYNGIDARSFDFANAVDPARITVGLVSSNIPKKGVLDFLELARRAEESLPTLEFHLVGPENRLPKELRPGAQPLPRNFRLRGYVAHPPDAYRDLNLVVNLSRFAESFGRTVAEAMLARRPVVAYRQGALPELIDDGETGFLVPYLDLSGVLERLRFFVEQPEKIAQFGEMARSRIAERCSPDLFARRVTVLYERLIGASARPSS